MGLPEETGEFSAIAEVDAGAAGWLEGAADGAIIEQQLGGATGLGAETPAISDPRPSLCNVGASSFPSAWMPFADWNFSTAATVLPSHLPFGSPW